MELGAWRGSRSHGLAGRYRRGADTGDRRNYNDPAFQQAMTDRGFGLRWRNAEDFAAYMAEQESVYVRRLRSRSLSSGTIRCRRADRRQLSMRA